MRHARTIAVLAALSLTSFLMLAQGTSSDKPAGTGKSENVTTKAKPRGAGSPQIKNESPKNDVKVTIPAPPNKGGSKTRGTGPYACEIHVDNRTPYVISIYVDVEKKGYELSGQVPRYGDLVGKTGNGSTSIYGLALFTDGSSKEWGPTIFTCPAGGEYTWTLTE